jgi:nitroreductase/NAD-dependent dihydropyrimidine dehydrogenase PreA subunit
MVPERIPIEVIRFEIAIDPQICNRDGYCVRSCAWGVFRQAEPMTVPEVAFPENCVLCGHCLAVCPENALDHSGLNQENFPPWDPESVLPPEDLITFLRSRRSIRNYHPRKSVSEHDLLQVLDAARYAPTGCNAQTLEYLVVRDPVLIRELSSLTLDLFQELLNPETITSPPSEERKLLAEVWADAGNGSDPIFFNAPVLVIIHASRSTPCPVEDATLAAMHSLLAAHSLDLGTCLIGNFYKYANQSAAIRTRLGIPEGNQILMSFTLGHPILSYRKLVERKPLRVEWK